MSRRWILILAIPLTLLLGALLVAYFTIVAMPLQTFSGTLPPLHDDEKNLAAEMRQYVLDLAGGIGERNVANYPNLQASAGYISATLESFGYHVFGQVLPHKDMTVLRGIEGARLKETYRLTAEKFEVPW